jgi:hypothetical protein
VNTGTIIFVPFVFLFVVVSIFLTEGIRKLFPKSFSVISSARIVWPAAFCFNLLDGLSTWFLVGGEKMNMAGEGNPLIRFTLEHVGNGAGLFLYKALLCTILIILVFRKFQPRERVAIVFFFFLLCVNNLANLILIR